MWLVALCGVSHGKAMRCLFFFLELRAGRRYVAVGLYPDSSHPAAKNGIRSRPSVVSIYLQYLVSTSVLHCT